jgi:hypothetical protein
MKKIQNPLSGYFKNQVKILDESSLQLWIRGHDSNQSF